MRKKSAEKKWV